MRNTLAFAITSLLIAIPLLAIKADTNDVLSRRILAVYPAADSDGDGTLSKAELAAVGRVAIKNYPQADANGDGILSVAEQKLLLDHLEKNDSYRTSQEAPATMAANRDGDDKAIRQGPRPIKPGDVGIGRQIPNLTVTDLSGQQHQLSDFKTSSAVVIALTGNGCPLCLKYAPTLSELEKKYSDKNITFIFINPNESADAEKMRQAVMRHELQGPYVHDIEKDVTRILEAQTTTEVFVVDSSRTLVYRGAVDDQYGFGYSLKEARKHFLVDALDAVLSESTPEVQATSSPGCELYYDRSTKSQVTLTYHNRISRIMQANCVECHREGGIAPISLESYAEVKDYASMIGNVVQRGVMPPWFASPEESDDGDEGVLHWANDRSLSSSEKTDLFTWIKSGAPEGDSEDAPLIKEYPDGWLIGQPDAVFEFPKPVAIKATGIMPYKHVTVETNLPEDKWVQAIEVRPGKLDVVHHVIVSVRGGNREVDERDGYWGAYVPGNSTLIYPDGYARLLPKNAKLRFQMHYTPNGTATTDSTRIGLIFSDKPPRHEVKVAGIANDEIEIPPRASKHEETAEITVPHDIELLAFLPHMHLRGAAARYDLISQHGNETLLDIPRYDFNWQLLYRLAEPKSLKRGDTIRFTGWFDNSSNNPANPNPNTTVEWGQQTEDEMLLGYVEYVIPDAIPGEPAKSWREKRDDSGNIRIGRQQVDIASLLEAIQRLDSNQDGKLTVDEVPEKHLTIFRFLDINDDDILTVKEAKTAISRNR